MSGDDKQSLRADALKKKDKIKEDEEELKEKLDDDEEEELEEDDKEDEEEDEDEEIASLAAKVAQLEEQLKRAVADYRNLEARSREEKLEFVKYANKNLIEALLPAFDTLILAEKYTNDQNFKVTVKHVLDVLKNAGIERVETVGKKFEPGTMEAVEVVEGPEDEVIEETQPGFTLNGKIIRPARVKVGKGN